MLPADALVHHVNASSQQQAGEFMLQAAVGRAHRAELELTGELEAVFGIVGLDFHAPIIGPQANKPKSIHKGRRHRRRPAALQLNIHSGSTHLPGPLLHRCGFTGGNRLYRSDNVVFGTDK